MKNTVNVRGVSELQVENETTKTKTENKKILQSNENLENNSFLSYNDLKFIRELVYETLTLTYETAAFKIYFL